MARNMIFRLLTDNNFNVVQFENGKDAWTHLETVKRKAAEDGVDMSEILDIIILDIEMPLMDGHHLTKKIKEDPALKGIPVLLCSSIITESLFHKGVSVGADAQISKAQMSELIEKAMALINKSA